MFEKANLANVRDAKSPSTGSPAAYARGITETVAHTETSAGIDPSTAPNALPLAKLQVLSGSFAGRELELTKALTTLGRPGVQVAAMNCDKFNQPGVCPDGKKHKYKLNGKPRAVKDFARSGYLGFQDHGHKVWYKNVKLLKLKLKKK